MKHILCLPLQLLPPKLLLLVTTCTTSFLSKLFIIFGHTTHFPSHHQMTEMCPLLTALRAVWSRVNMSSLSWTKSKQRTWCSPLPQWLSRGGLVSHVGFVLQQHTEPVTPARFQFSAVVLMVLLLCSSMICSVVNFWAFNSFWTTTQFLQLSWASLQDQYRNFTVRLMRSKSPYQRWQLVCFLGNTVFLTIHDKTLI